MTEKVPLNLIEVILAQGSMLQTPVFELGALQAHLPLSNGIIDGCIPFYRWR